MTSSQKTHLRPEIKHVLETLRTAIKVLGYSVRDIEKQLGYSQGYLSRVFSGAIELKVEHVVDIALALKMAPEEILAFVYPHLKDPPSQAAWELWQRVGGKAPTGTFRIRKMSDEEAAEERMERALRRALGRIFADITRTVNENVLVEFADLEVAEEDED
ncbi:MAG TPA: helix-turn-helix transcriptional regulator [Thermoanaerobaculia bacterium]|jgi:transcriptional regulator with XRE-family HTH domain|nr:helix-turn-helix transcriptional regulator [Thermoanaerobaculia bacterium]